MKSIVERELLDNISIGTFVSVDVFFPDFLAQKVPRYTYSIMLDASPSEKAITFWEVLFSDFVDDEDFEWEDIHNRNFKCTIETQLRSFYLTIFHRAIGFNQFYLKLGERTPLCVLFCNKVPENTFHVFCECDKVRPI